MNVTLIFFLLLFSQLGWSQTTKKTTDLPAVKHNEIKAKNEKIALNKESLLKSCREKITVTYNIHPMVGICTAMSCDGFEGSCCNTCSGGAWGIVGTFIPAKGKILPLCKPDGCGKFSSPSCKTVSASGMLQNCDSDFSLSFEVQVIN